MAPLQHAFLNNDHFSTIPVDFFNGLTDLHEISLGNDPCLNASRDGSGGLTLPLTLADSVQQLQVLSLDNCNLTGAIPDFLGRLTSLENLTPSPMFNNQWNWGGWVGKGSG